MPDPDARGGVFDQAFVRQQGGSAVLCREEAMVYLENYSRGSCQLADLQALVDYLSLVPESEVGSLPFDTGYLLSQIQNEIDTISMATNTPPPRQV